MGKKGKVIGAVLALFVLCAGWLGWEKWHEKQETIPSPESVQPSEGSGGASENKEKKNDPPEQVPVRPEKLTKTQWMDKIVGMEQELNRIYREATHADTDPSSEPEPFESVRPKLQEYFSDRYIDNVLKDYYRSFYMGTDWFPLGLVSKTEMELRSEIVEEKAESVKFRAAKFANELQPAGYYTYSFRYEKDRWLLDDVHFEELARDGEGFGLSKEEAETFAQYVYSHEMQIDGRLRFVKTERTKNGPIHHFQGEDGGGIMTIRVHAKDGYLQVNEFGA